MQTYRVYFMDSRSIIAAEMVEAASHGDAAESAVHGLDSYSWAGKLAPTRLESGKERRSTSQLPSRGNYARRDADAMRASSIIAIVAVVLAGCAISEPATPTTEPRSPLSSPSGRW